MGKEIDSSLAGRFGIKSIVHNYDGEILGRMFPGDRIVRAESIESYNKVVHNWGSGRPFVKVYSDMVPYLHRDLTKTELCALFSLIPHTSYEDCKIRSDGTNRNSKILTLPEMCEVIGEKYDNGRRIIRGLYKKGVIAKLMTTNEDLTEREVFYMNPYIIFKGTNLDKSKLEDFNKTIWFKYYNEINLKD